jgi:hypothetical protein
VDQAIFTVLGAQVMSFLLPLTHVTLVNVFHVQLYPYILFLFYAFTFLLVIRALVRVKQFLQKCIGVYYFTAHPLLWLLALHYLPINMLPISYLLINMLPINYLLDYYKNYID